MVVHQPGDTLTCALELVQHRLPDVRPHHGRQHFTGFPLRLFVRIVRHQYPAHLFQVIEGVPRGEVGVAVRVISP